MKWYNKIKDYPTGDYASFTKEKEVYDSAVSEISALEDLLDCYVEEGALKDFDDKCRSIPKKAQMIKNSIFLHKKKLAKTSTKIEAENIEREIKKLEQEYESALEKIKNELLECNQITELQNHKTELIVIISGNASLVAFKGFVNKKTWTLKDLINLREQISNRNVIIIDYIGKMR